MSIYNNTLTTIQNDIQMKYMPDIFTVRLSKEEQSVLEKRSKRAGMKKATFIRKLILDEEIVTGNDLLSWANRNAGNEKLRISKVK